MKFRGLLAAVVVLAALGGAAWWSERKEKADAGKPPADAPPKILNISEDQFKQIQLARKSGETTEVSRAGGAWQIVQPKPLAADEASVMSLVSSLAALTSDRLIEDKPLDYSTYGFTTPAERITITRKDGKVQTLLIGDDTPTGSGAFAKVDGDPRVFTIASYIKTNLDKTSKDLRDKRLLTFNSDKLTRVYLTAKGPGVEFGKNNQNEWQILKPRPLRADGLQVDELVRKLKDAKMDASGSDEDAKKAIAGFSIGTRVAMAAVTDASGTQQIEVRKDKDKNYYAKSSVVEGIYKITSDVGDGLDKGLDDFRNKKLFDFGFNDPGKLEIRNGTAQATYQKSGEKWMSGARQMDAPSIQALVDKLRDLTSTKFLEFGTGPAIFEATVTSNDGKRTEKVTIWKMGATCLARREGETTVYEIDAKAVEDLQKAATEVKEFQPPKSGKK
ncbi:MAG: DUF4340 domain-containing protein [Acidobacteriia bacterium]|nr:DUF4340 domain-containing protein [Terriglobia bacterium]